MTVFHAMEPCFVPRAETGACGCAFALMHGCVTAPLRGRAASSAPACHVAFGAESSNGTAPMRGAVVASGLMTRRCVGKAAAMGKARSGWARTMFSAMWFAPRGKRFGHRNGPWARPPCGSARRNRIECRLPAYSASALSTTSEASVSTLSSASGESKDSAYTL